MTRSETTTEHDLPLLRSFTAILLAALFVASSLRPATAQEPATDAAPFDTLERTLADALHRKDRAALESLLAPEFVLRGNPDVSRTTWLDNAIKYCWGERSDIAKLRAIPSDQMAVVTFELTFYTNPQTCEPQTNGSLITDIWMQRDGRWQLAVRHSAPLTPDGADPIQQQFAALPEPPPVLEGNAELSFVSTGGNSETHTLGSAGAITWRADRWTTTGTVAFVSAEAEGVTSARSLAGDVRESYRFSPRIELYAHGGYRRDLFAGIESRVALDGGVAFAVLTTAPHELRVDLGAGFVNEDRLEQPIDRFAASTAVGDYKWTISEHSTLTDTIALTASLEDAADWRASNGLALTVELNRMFALKLSHKANYLNRPVEGFRKLDTVTSIAFVATFARRPAPQ